MIPAHIIKKIKRIHIKSSRAVNTMMAGQYRSVFRGTGIEFEEVREYSPGDDVKTIDWKVSARLGRPFVKLYREERERIVMLMVDMSRSLNFGTFHGRKLEKVAEIASVLAFNAVRNNDKVGALFFTDHVEKYIPPKKGSAHVWRLIREIFTFSPGGGKTCLSAGFDYLSKVAVKKALVFVVSDFISDPYEQSLKRLKARHEIIGVLVSDTADTQLPGRGIVTLCDFETGRTIMVDASDKKVRNWYETQKNTWTAAAVATFSKARSDMVQIGTRDTVSDALTRYFKYRELRYR